MKDTEIESYAIKIFSHLESFDNYFTNGDFSLNTLIDNYLDFNIAIDGSDFQLKKDEENNRIATSVCTYLIENKYFERVNLEDDTMRLTKRGKEAIKLGGIIEFKHKLNEDNELKVLNKDSLIATVEANKISEKANEISEKAKKISLYSIFISLGAILVSIILAFVLDDVSEKDINNLNTEIESIKKKQSDIEAFYIKHVDSLKNEIDKVK